MRKFQIVLLLLGVAFFTSAFSIKEWKTSLYDQIKTEAEKNFSALFNRPVKIESAGGIVIGQIDLKEMFVPGIGRASKVVLSFNPIKYAFAKGDMIPALTKITVIDGNFKVTRDRSGHWNFSSLLAQEGGKAAPPPPFRGRLFFKNCRVDYLDQIGFRGAPQKFEVQANEVNGALDLRQKDRVKFALSGKVPEFVKAQGLLDLKTGKYDLNVSAGNLNLEKWANYVVPQPDLKFLGGTADIFLQVVPPKIKGWPASLIGKVTFHNGSARIQEYSFSHVAGDFFIADENLSLKNLKCKANYGPLTLKGILETRVTGAFSRPQLEGNWNVSEGKIFEQKLSGALRFSFKENLLLAETDNLVLYRGIASGKVSLNFSKVEPELNLSARISKLNLAALAQNAPGLEGQADGTIELSGPFNHLSGKTSATLRQALIFGQPMKDMTASFKIKNGDFFLENFAATSGSIFFSSRGRISRDLFFDLEAEAAGLRLSGKGILGKMQAILNKFKGNMRGQINPALLASPLKNLFASGEAVLSDGQIGEQLFDRAEGKIDIGGGRIQVEESFIQRKESVLRISGQTGLGSPTSLKISANAINLEDLKLLNHFLPPEAKDPRGLASMEVEVTGLLSSETTITSFDPFLSLTAKGALSLSGGLLAEIPISNASLNFAWQDKSLFLSNCRMKLPDSTLVLNLDYKNDGTIRASLEGTANLSHLQPMAAKFGKIDGKAGINLQLEGPAQEPSITASFWINNFLFNEVYFDSIAGSLNYSRQQLTLLEPVLFRSGSDLYVLSGKASENSLDLHLKILQADLNSTYRLLGKLQGEFVRRFSPPAEGKFSKINLSNLALPPGSWNAIRQEFEKQFAAAPEETLGGKLTGELQLKGKMENPSGKFNLRVINGFFKNYQFDEFNGSASLKNQEIKIEKAVLSKGKGNISARGDYNFNGKVFLHVVANDMPLDILKLVFPGKEFKGIFNMNAGFDGLLQNLRISLSAAGKEVSFAGVDFDKASISVTKKDDSIYLHELSLIQEGSLSSAYGSIQLSHPGQIDLEANLKGNAIGLLNLFTDEVRWLKGDSAISLKVTGSLENPKIKGNIKVNHGTLYVRSVDSELSNLQGTASIESNLLKIASLTGILSGKRTRDLPNPLGLAGTIDISKLLAEKSMVDLNLAFSPVHLYLAFPNLYTGSLYINELFLQGPFYFDLSEGPLLKGKVEVADADISLQQPPPLEGKVPPLNFDLEANLTRNVYAVMGNVMTLNLSYIFMNLEIAGEGLKIHGNLEAPSLLGKISIKRGTVNIFNREFTLVPPEIQERYFPYAPEKIQENVASFTGEEGPAGILPKINMTSTVNVESLEKDESVKYVKKTINIMARLKGTMGAKQEEEGIKITLLSFTEDKTKTPPEMIPAAYSEQDLKVMLLPDFIKSLAGIGRPEEVGEAKVDVNVIAADYLASWGQAFLFRTIERQAEKTLGLESLTLEYNLGPKVREALGIKEVRGFEIERPAWSVGFVKGVTDRLYVDVRYAQGMEQAVGPAAKTTFNYQLTYKLNPIWSIIYYREPISLTEITTGYQKVTLKAGFSLW